MTSPHRRGLSRQIHRQVLGKTPSQQTNLCSVLLKVLVFLCRTLAEVSISEDISTASPPLAGRSPLLESIFEASLNIHSQVPAIQRSMAGILQARLAYTAISLRVALKIQQASLSERMGFWCIFLAMVSLDSSWASQEVPMQRSPK